MPQPLSSFIGREAEIQAVCALVDADARLITLTGPGGVGKTRLAIAVAEQLSNSLKREIAFVSLAPIADYRLVVPTIARSVGVDESADQPVFDRLVMHFSEHQSVLFLDNVEHLLESGPEVALLLQACRELTVVATGREPLRLHGEHEFAVHPLGLIDGEEPTDPTRRQESPAVRLFVERATQASRHFALTVENAAVVHEICRRLDGLPLALELAAARMKVLSAADLLARLDEPLSVLTGGPRDAPDRQQTMRATLQWSYDLLEPDEQRLLRELSVFAGGATLDAIEAVSPNGPVVEHLGSLVDKSLVLRLDESREAARYDMLEPVRQFAREHLLVDSNEASHARQQHAAHFNATVVGARQRLNGPEGPELFAQLELERDNLRAALSWFHETHQADIGLRMVEELVLFWLQHDYIFEGRRHVEAFLNLPEARQPTVERASLLSVASWLWIHRWMDPPEIDTALLMVEEACAIASELGDRRALAHALFMRGVCRVRRGEVDQVRSDWVRAIPLARECGDDPTVARLLAHLAGLALRRGDLDQARATAEESLSIVRAKDLKMVMGPAISALGATLERSGEDRRAADLYRERLYISRELDMPLGIAAAFDRFARLFHRRGDAEQAVCLFAVATGIRNRSGSDWSDPLERSIIDEDLNVLRARLPEERFRAAWERGHAMTVEEAAALVQCLFEEEGPRSPEWPDGLTPREVEVLALIAAGRSNRQMAEDLFLSIRTVERHVANIYRKIDVHNRAEATAYAYSRGIVKTANT